MEYIPQNRLLNYKPDTLHFLRNQYGLDTVKRVNDAIDAIQEWSAKQEHFGKKSFDRDFLERLLINNKGLVEKSKRKLDKLCTIITLIPDFFDLQPIDKEVIFGSLKRSSFKIVSDYHYDSKRHDLRTIFSYCSIMTFINVTGGEEIKKNVIKNVVFKFTEGVEKIYRLPKNPVFLDRLLEFGTWKSKHEVIRLAISKISSLTNRVKLYSKKMTPDYGRVHFVQILPGNLNSYVYQHYCRYFVLIHQYLQQKDYCNYITIVVDYADDSLLDFMKALDIPALRKCVEIAIAAFSMRIKSIHLISSSKAVDLFISIVKPLLGDKIGSRVINHLCIETVYDYVPREILPKEYGGNDKPLSQKRDELYDELHSPEFTKDREQFNEASTNEALRQKDKFNEDYLGISGTFRTLTVD